MLFPVLAGNWPGVRINSTHTDHPIMGCGVYNQHQEAGHPPGKTGPHPHPASSVKLSQTLQRASACFWSLLQMLERNKCLCRLYRELPNQNLLEWDSDRWMVGKLLSGSLMGTPVKDHFEIEI